MQSQRRQPLATQRRQPSVLLRRPISSKYRHQDSVLPMRRDTSISYNHTATPYHDEELRPKKSHNFSVFQHRLMGYTHLMRKEYIDRSRHHHDPDAIGIGSTRKSTNPSTSSHSNRSPSDGESIDNVTIFRQLSILKRGGYWKHLQREEEYREETTPQQSWRIYDGGKDENKENAANDDIDEDDNDDDDDDDEEEIDDGYLVEYAFNTDRVDLGGPHGFYIHAITEDGWVCSDDRLRDNDDDVDVDVNDDDQQYECEGEARRRRRRRQNVQQQLSTLPSSSSSSTLLLRLPKKVASLGREGMFIIGINLMKRRDNGAVEPCNHYSNSNHGIVVRSSSEDLYGRILI
jgi:hypothetical protein